MSLLTQASLVLTPNAYKANKLYSIIPSSGNGDMATTRATTATRVNSNGLVESVATGIPRLDYTGSVPSILLEPQRTNLATNSEDFSNGWGLVRTSLAINTATSPSGSMTADKVNQITGQTNSGGITKITSLQQGSKYTWTVFAKKEEKGFIRLSEKMTTSGVITSSWFNLVNGTTGTINAGHTATITNAGNGWYKCSITFTANEVVNDPLIIVFLSDIDNSTTVVDSGGVYLWGAQLEQGAYSTSYIPTTTSTVTRNVDIMTLNNIYTNNFITSAGGTWFTELTNNFSLTRDTGGQFGIGTTSEISLGSGLTIRRDSGTGRLLINKYISASGVPIYTTLTDAIKVAIKWNGTTADVFVNGVKVVTSTSFTTTAMQFIQGNTSDVPKYIKSFILFPTPLTDAECATLTTL
jgi:hypothetical protein